MEKRKKKKRIKRDEDNLRDLWDNIKCPNIRITGVPEEDKRKGHEKILEEIIVENFPKNGEGNSHPSPNNPESPKQDKPKAKHPKTHINLINKGQTQRENVKSSKRTTTSNTKRSPTRITADLPMGALQARREWQDVLEVMREKILLSGLLYPARISFKYEGEVKSFTDKLKLREFSITKPALQQMLKDLL